jgi:hypothetical protein
MLGLPAISQLSLYPLVETPSVSELLVTVVPLAGLVIATCMRFAYGGIIIAPVLGIIDSLGDDPDA